MNHLNTFTLILVPLLIGMVFYECLMSSRAVSSSDWYRCSARVVEVKVEALKHYEDGEKYRAFVKYQYSYLGSVYHGSSFYLDHEWLKNYDDAWNNIRAIHEGSDIVVYVNPKKPSISVLNKGHNGGSFWNIVFIIAMMVVLIVYDIVQ